MSDERHDREFDGPLRAALRGPDAGAGAGEACPDAERLALYAARELDAGEREALEPHLARCARCQAILAVLVTADDIAADAVAPSPLPAATTPTGPVPGELLEPQTTPGGRASAFGRGWWRWVLPLPAAAMVAALYFAVRPAPAPAPSFEMAARDTARADHDTAPANRDTARADRDTALLDRDSARASGDTAPADRDTAAAGREKATAPRDEAVVAPKEEARRQAATGTGAAATEQELGEARAEAVQPAEVRTPVTEVTAPAAKARPPAAAARASAPPVTLAAQAEGRIIDLPSTGAPRFRIDAAGRLWTRPESANEAAAGFDAPSAWRPVPLPLPATLRAGACESASVCWVAGRDGLVFRTGNGRDWVRVPSPTTTEIVAILVVPPGRVVLTTVDGTRYETRDNGVTWTAL